MTAGEFSGEGTLKLLRTGLKAAYAGCTVSVAGFEVLHDSSYPSNYSWLDGGTAESEKMVVESAVAGSGNLACNNYVEVNGDVTLTGSLKLSANATVKNLVYDNGGCKIASDSAGGTIEKVTVKSGTLEYSSSTLKSVSAITVGKFVLDGGTLSVTSDFSGTIAVAEGGGTLFLEGEWNDDASVSLPAGLSFAEGADLSKVTVQATIGESTSPATFAIVNHNEAYSLEYVGYPFHLEELDLADGSLATSIASVNVAKGVLLITAGTPILGSAEIGEHGAIAVDVSGLVTTTTSTTEGDKRIDLFSAASLTLPEGESLSDVIVLTGPSCEYTLHSETQDGTTKVYAKITDVANAGISRKVTVWKAGEGWNNESGNWSNGAPGDESEDIGVFCGDAKLNFHNQQSDWVVTYAQMLVRGATVKLFANNHSAPNITFRKITGNGRLEALGINLMPLDTLTVGAGIETVTGAGNGFDPTISVGNGVTFDGPIVIGENMTINVVGYEDEVVLTGGSINFPANMKFAEGVTSATVAVAGHSDLTVSLNTDENGKIAASVVASIVKWVGGASDSKWATAANWEGGSVPTEETTVWFDASADVGLNEATAAHVFVAEGAVVRFYSTDPHSVPKRSLKLESMSGGGKVQLSNVRLMANGEDNAFTNIKVAELELLQEQRWDGAGNVDYPGSILESASTKWLRICSDISGNGGLECTKFTMHFCGNNSNYTGYASFNSGGGDNQTNRHFEKPESLFGNAQEFKFVGKMFLDFSEGTGKLGNANFGESWGATFETKPNANVTLEVKSGKIVDTYFGDGFEVNGGGTLTIKKIGKGTLVYGVTKQHNLVVAGGRVEFTGELWQLDATPDYFFGRGHSQLHLIDMLDDCSRLQVGCSLYTHERVDSYLHLFYKAFMRYGLPLQIYVDKATFFCKDDGSDTQLAKRLRFYGITFMCANTPAAKGKIERVHQVWQDRLPRYFKNEGVGVDTPLEDVNRRIDSLVDYRNDFEAHSEIRMTPRAAWEKALAEGRSKLRPIPDDGWWELVWAQWGGIVIGPGGKAVVDGMWCPTGCANGTRGWVCRHVDGTFSIVLNKPEHGVRPRVAFSTNPRVRNV